MKCVLTTKTTTKLNEALHVFISEIHYIHCEGNDPYVSQKHRIRTALVWLSHLDADADRRLDDGIVSQCHERSKGHRPSSPTAGSA